MCVCISGFEHDIVASAERVRSTCDERIERYVLGGEIATSRTQKAFRNVRTNNLSELRLLHLLDEEDNGTAQDPLKAFAKGDFGTKITAVFERISQVQLAALLPCAIEASTFFILLRKELTEAKALGVPLDVISEFYRATMAKVCAPVRAFALGSSGPGAFATFDIEFIRATSTARSAFDRAISQAVARSAAAAAAKNVRAPNKNDKKRGAGDKSDKGKGDRNDKNAKAAKGAGTQLLKDHNKAAPKREPSVQDGASVPFPDIKTDPGKAELKKFRDECKAAAFGDRNVNQCWHWWHPQGCDKADSCAFAHGSA